MENPYEFDFINYTVENNNYCVKNRDKNRDKNRVKNRDEKRKFDISFILLFEQNLQISTTSKKPRTYKNTSTNKRKFGIS